VKAVWLRWCDREGNVIPTGAELAEAERARAEAEQRRAEAERARAERLAARLRALGIDPDAEAL
jgi:regulator of protease activity HflC (stomatin/prohibitin superfamily)